MENLNDIIKSFVKTLGAVDVGFATTETLKGGPPSADITYVLPKAKSAVCFAVPLNQDHIIPFLSKKDRMSHDQDNVRANTIASGIALDLSNYLEQKGFKSLPQSANVVYRTDTKNGPLDEVPPISHRYLAVRSGLGHFGFSGNVIRKDTGAAVIFSSVITEAELVPTDPLPKEDNYCDNCKLCFAACASGLMDTKEDVTITLGGVEFTYSKRKHHNRCDYVCGGFTGLHKSGKWSTWSPGRFPIPEKDEEFLPALIQAIKPNIKRPSLGGGFHHFLVPGNKVSLTCGNCAIICHPDKEERKKRYDVLVKSGVVVQNEDGSLEAVTPEEAENRLEQMSPEQKSLYMIVE